MPSKRGSKVAAAQAKAKEAAKKKSRQSGPSLAAAAYVPPEPEKEETEEDADKVLQAPDKTASRPVLNRAQAVRSISMRRERHAEPVLSGNLTREVSMIGILTVLMGAALVALKFATDLGA
ncbi:MAG: hypothetical protein WD533_09010 [Dehalococcoidia bacterium]